LPLRVELIATLRVKLIASQIVEVKVTRLYPQNRDVRIPCLKALGPQHFVQWRLTAVVPQYGTCFTSPCWSLELPGDFYIFGKFVDPCLKNARQQEMILS